MATGSTTSPLPSPPFFDVPNLNNFRDAALACGGLKTAEGRRIRSGVLFRCADVSKVDGEGWRTLGGLGVRHVFDLRSKPEVDKGWAGITGEEGKDADAMASDWEAGLKNAGIDRSWVPVFAADDYSPERLAERYMKYLDSDVQGFISAYHDILTNGGPAFRSILLYLASLPPPSPSSSTTDPSSNPKIAALIHCTAGKDRTGIFFGLLLSLLGVPDTQIAEEYNLTEPGLQHIYEAVLPRLMASAAFERYKRENLERPGVDAEEEGRKAALRMLGARRESMLGALEMLRNEWGSAEGYVRGVCGLGDGEVEALRRNLVVDG